MKRLLSCSSGIGGTFSVLSEVRDGEFNFVGVAISPSKQVSWSLLSSETMVLGDASSRTDRTAE